MGFYSESAFKSSLDDTWRTPKAYFAQINDEFGFGLDAAALQSSTLVPHNWYGPDHPDAGRRDAFKRIWSEDTNAPIWLNPPYGRTIGDWMKKANEEAELGATVVCLVPSRTDTKWWHEYAIQHTVRFIKGRLRFNDANPAPFPSALVILNG